MEKKLNRFDRFIRRVVISWRIVWREQHVVVLYVDKENFIRVIKGKPLKTVDIAFTGMMKHQSGQIIKDTAGMISDIDLLCAKAEFDSRVEESQSQAKNKPA